MNQVTFVTSCLTKDSGVEWHQLKKHVEDLPGSSLGVLCSVMHRINSLYDDVQAVKQANDAISACCTSLSHQDAWRRLSKKFQKDAAKVLSHLSVKVANKGCHETCMLCCHLLLSIAWQLEDLEQNERLRLTGYVYKSLWNKHTVASTCTSDTDSVFIERAMAVQMSMASGWHQLASKLIQQINLAVSTCTNKRRVSEGLTEIQLSVSRAVDKYGGDYKHLSMFVSCLLAVHSPDYTQVDSCGDTGALCQVLLDCYRRIDRDGKAIDPVSEQLLAFTTSVSSSVHLYSLAALSTAACKAITSKPYKFSDVQTLVSWSDMLLADAHINRRFYELEVGNGRKMFLSTEALNFTKLACVLADIIYEWQLDSQEEITLLITRLSKLLTSVMDRAVECDCKRLQGVAESVGHIVHAFVKKPDHLHGVLVELKQLVATTLSFLAFASCFDALVQLRRRACDLFAKHGQYQLALDLCKEMKCLPNEYWQQLVVDWCQVKKMATTALALTTHSTLPSVASRVLAVEVFNSLANRDDIIWLLLREFSEFTVKEAYKEILETIVNELKVKAVSKLHSALYYLCKTEVFFFLDVDMTLAEKCIQKGLKLLDGDLSSYVNDIKAQLHTWKYVLSYRHSTCVSKVTEALSQVNYEALSVGVTAQLNSQQPLHLAIDLWKAVVGSPNNIYCMRKTIQCLDIISSTLYSARNLNKLLLVGKLAADLLSPPNVPQSMFTLQVEAALLLGDVKAAKEMLDQLKDDGSDEVVLLRAGLALHSGEVELVVSLLCGLILKQKKSTLEDVRILASAHRMLLHLVMNNASVGTESSSAHHAWHCQREHASMLNSLSHFPVRTYGMKLRYLDDLLSSYITLGKWNLLVGNVRECQCFLQAALNMSRLLILPLREVEVLITQAKLDCFLADFDGAKASLQRIHSILTSERSLTHSTRVDVEETTPKGVSKGSKAVKDKSRVMAVKNSSLFGFESEEDQEESFSMKLPQNELSDEDTEYNVPSYDGDGLRSAAASPSLKNPLELKIADWAPSKHPATCECDTCSNSIHLLSYLDMLHVLCTFRLHSGEVDGAIQLAKECLDHCGCVGDKLAQQGQSSVHLTLCRLNLHYTVMKGSLMVNAVEDIEKEWEAVKSVKTNDYHKLIMCQLTYMSYLPQLSHQYQLLVDVDESEPAGSTTDYTNMSSPLKLLNINSAAPHSSIVRAPRKTRTAIGSKLSQLAFDDSDEENSTSTVKRGRKPTTRTKKVGSTPRVASPLAVGPSRIRSTKKTPITVFCDDMEGDQPLEPKRSARARKVVSRGMSAERRTTRKSTRTKETMRSFSTGDVDNLDPQLVGEIFSPVKEVADDESIELLRGDEEINTGSKRKCSTAEAMRSTVAPEVTSPPEFLISPVIFQGSAVPTGGGELIPSLTDLWNSIQSHPPYELYRWVCQSLALLHHRQSNHWLAAFYLMETHAITLSHKTSLVAAQKYHQRKKEPNSINQKPIIELPKKKTIKEFKKAINSIPAGCVAVVLSLVSMPGRGEQQLFLTRLEKNQEPVIVLASKMPRPQNIWKEFAEILQDSKSSMRETKKDIWWEKRRAIDERLKALLTNVEKQLGVARASLLGLYTDSRSKQVVEKVTDTVMKELSSLSLTSHRSLIRMLVNGAEHVSVSELVQLLSLRYPDMAAADADRLANKVKEGVRVNIDSRQPVILCLDKDAHSLCWESMAYISENPYTRMSSLYAIQSSVQALTASSAVYVDGIDSDLTFYILNPDDNLPATEALFKPLLASKNWPGIVATKPTSEEYKQALTDHHLFIFLGHGNGSKFLKARELCRINCEAAVLLMGCSSGALDSRGSMESAGIINDYQIANCPSVMACLWDVTDKDIDRFTHNLIDGWLMAGEDNPCLLEYIPAARRACKLKYLVGAASVVYGLPVSLKVKK